MYCLFTQRYNGILTKNKQTGIYLHIIVQIASIAHTIDYNLLT